MPQVLDGVDAPLIPGAKYGLGVIVRPSLSPLPPGVRDLGPSYGHSGFFPGYVTDMRYFPEHGICVAVQINSSAGGQPTGSILYRLAGIVIESKAR
jgi:D-alanyl-D-alanine carboxypeptidase